MGEAVVERYEDETEAETAAGYLRTAGLHARVRYRATMGAPRQMVPIRVVPPLGDYELVVLDEELADARDALGDIGLPAERPRRYRGLGIVLVVVWLLPLIFSAVVAVSGVFGR